MTFGTLLRSLRYKEDIGIKKLAAEINVDYAYLSRIENDKLKPSERVIERISRYFNYNKDELMILGDKIPEDIKKILRENPEEALSYLREKFSGYGNRR
jgi:transcriptional regulator with XRE-family HTH domain